jgi:hypothetical protein
VHHVLLADQGSGFILSLFFRAAFDRLHGNDRP